MPVVTVTPKDGTPRTLNVSDDVAESLRAAAERDGSKVTDGASKAKADDTDKGK